MLIPPREFSYNIGKGLVTLFNSAHLSTGISMSDIICNGKTIESKYKGKEYYSSLLKKKFNCFCTKLVVVPHPDDLQLHLQSGWDTNFIKKTKIAFSK
jgi:hypothetical protein